MSLLYIFLSSVIQLPFGAKLPELQTHGAKFVAES